MIQTIIIAVVVSVAFNIIRDLVRGREKMSEYIQNGTSLYKEVEPNTRADYKTDIDEFEFKRTPETDAMLKQLCIKECIVRCKDCIWGTKKTIYRHDKVEDEYWSCGRYEPIDPDDGEEMTENDFCSRGELK